MKGLGMGFRDLMGGTLGPVQHEFDHTNAIINTWSKKEHNSDGTHGDLTASSVTSTGAMAFGGPWTVPDTNVISPPQLTANTDNYRPNGIDAAVVLRLSTDVSRNLTGLYNAAIDEFRWLLIMNVGNADLVLKHNVTSTAAYRFACFGSADVTVNSADSVWVFYDASSGNWRVIGV